MAVRHDPCDVREEHHPHDLRLLARAAGLLPVGANRVHEDRAHHAEVVVGDAAEAMKFSKLQQVFGALQLTK